MVTGWVLRAVSWKSARPSRVNPGVSVLSSQIVSVEGKPPHTPKVISTFTVNTHRL